MRTALLLFKNVQKRIYICSDNKAAIANLAKPPPNQLWESMQKLENLSRSNEVTLLWVYGHHAILANEVDKLAEIGIMESILTNLLASPLLWVQRSLGII